LLAIENYLKFILDDKVDNPIFAPLSRKGKALLKRLIP